MTSEELCQEKPKHCVKCGTLTLQGYSYPMCIKCQSVGFDDL